MVSGIAMLRDGKPFKLLREDKAVPGHEGKPAVLAVLVQRFRQGFEGRDRRFIAVTGQAR
ncbi:hypothetical protein AJ88_41765 [Mesorhizobium amorphae CCBAU 01583]|nr:hypothetical protein AJ88_41765 [Mesorhizobium amorphae CCBAU 01583]